MFPCRRTVLLLSGRKAELFGPLEQPGSPSMFRGGLLDERFSRHVTMHWQPVAGRLDPRELPPFAQLCATPADSHK